MKIFLDTNVVLDVLGKRAPFYKTSAAVLSLAERGQVTAVDEDVLKEALSLNWKDYEDAVQAVVAIKSKSTHFITRNVRDFSNLTLKVMTPEEFLGL